MHTTKYSAIAPAATQESKFLDVSRDQLKAPKSYDLTAYKSWAKDVMIHNRIFDKQRQQEAAQAKATWAPKRRAKPVKQGMQSLDSFLGE
jgi:hypothetical protein